MRGTAPYQHPYTASMSNEWGSGLRLAHGHALQGWSRQGARSCFTSRPLDEIGATGWGVLHATKVAARELGLDRYRRWGIY